MRTHDPDNDLLTETRPPSKSRLKRESAALRDLADALLELSEDRLVRLDLPAELREAVQLGQSITAHGGLKRQRKFIGKLLRGMDTEPIRAGLAAVNNEGAEATRRLHVIERWRDRMLAEGDSAVNDFVSNHPDADRQKLRQLVREARRERDEGKPPRSARLLFRHVRGILAVDEGKTD